MNSKKSINRKSINIHKNATQKNSIENYFGKSADPIYVQRLREEILAEGLQNSVLESQPTIENQSEDFKLLQKQYIDLQKKCEELEKQNTKLWNDNRALKKLLDKSKNLNLCKDIKIQQIKSNQIAVEPLKVQNNTVLISNGPVQVPNGQKKMLFMRYEEHFSPQQLMELRSLGIGKRKDAAFVTKCLEYIYQGKISVIQKRVAGDRRLKGKEPISPIKRRVLSEMLIERVEAEATDEFTSTERCDRLNRLLGDAIQTLTRRRVPNGEVESVITTTNQNVNAPTLSIPIAITPNNAVLDAFQFVSFPY